MVASRRSRRSSPLRYEIAAARGSFDIRTRARLCGKRECPAALRFLSICVSRLSRVCARIIFPPRSLGFLSSTEGALKRTHVAEYTPSGRQSVPPHSTHTARTVRSPPNGAAAGRGTRTRPRTEQRHEPRTSPARAAGHARSPLALTLTSALRSPGRPVRPLSLSLVSHPTCTHITRHRRGRRLRRPLALTQLNGAQPAWPREPSPPSRHVAATRRAHVGAITRRTP